MGLTLQGGRAGAWSGVAGAKGSGLVVAALAADGDLAMDGVWKVRSAVAASGEL